MLNSTRFHNAFVAIEQHLSKLVGGRKGDGFSDLLAKAARTDSAVKAHQDILRSYAALRNAIHHSPRYGSRGEAIAEPHGSIVEDIEKKMEMLTSPPRVDSHFATRVETFKPEDSLADVLKAMGRLQISQGPVYDGSGCIGVLTSNAISLHIGSKIDGTNSNLEDLLQSLVGDIITNTEDCQSYACIRRQANLFDVLELFTERAKQGTRLVAVLITDGGKKTQRPIGIVTSWDLQRIYETIGVKE